MNCHVVVYELADFLTSLIVHCCCGQNLTKLECSEGQIPLEKCYTTQRWGGGGHSGGLSLARLADFRSNTNSSRVFICSQVISRLRHSHTRKSKDIGDKIEGLIQGDHQLISARREKVSLYTGNRLVGGNIVIKKLRRG